jgi:signal transduction histidine kinase
VWVLIERVKELTCLHGITQITADNEAPLERVLQGAAELLPPAWQYSEIARARIVLDGVTFATGELPAGADSQGAGIEVDGVERGLIEVAYAEKRAPADEGPFLKEERHLINTVARQLGQFVAQREAAMQHFRHADRLATIGQLAAGVAHELNEPLGNILGFAQLARRSPGLADDVARDLDRIVQGSLYAREIVRKLMLFARQTPPRKTVVDVNQIVSDGLTFLESRCAGQQVELVRELDADLPPLTADPFQLNQVLVNLVVNAIQAMPDGGRLTIRTSRRGESIAVTVEDTGIGMSDEVRGRIFLPFFTTKEVDQGTGLGLSVVHGIVAAHGGEIAVESSPGAGSRFTISLPTDGAPGGAEG